MMQMRSQEVTEYYTLNQAKKHKSRTRPYPFIIAHECNKPYRDKLTGEPQVKTREFFVFDDVDTFLQLRDRYQHAHEAIWDRYTPEKQQGRLMFDFDFDEPWWGCKPKFVAPTFQVDVEKLVVRVFEKYYVNVDCSRFIFVWLVSDVDTKWSKHLIVKNAYFSDDWKSQSQVFYNLMLGMAEDEKFFQNYGATITTEKLFDSQVARSNATMRMLGSTKLAKPDKPLRLESPADATFFDTLVQLYQRKDVQVEQHINQACLRKDYLDSQLDEVTKANKFIKQAYKILDYDVDKMDYEADLRLLSQGEVNAFFKIFEEHYCQEFGLPTQNCFRVKSAKGSLITLERVHPGKCLISERVHDAENAFIIVKPNNDVYYGCYRGCDRDGHKTTRCYPQEYVEAPVKANGEDEVKAYRPSTNAKLLAQMMSNDF